MIYIFEGIPSSGQTKRLFLRKFSAYHKNGNPGLVHPFGFTFMNKKAEDSGQISSGEVFVSAQDADIVVRYEYPSGSLMELPLALQDVRKECLPSTFVASSNVVGKKTGLKSIRGVVYEPKDHLLYVSDKTDHSIKRYDATTGDFVDEIKHDDLATPIHLVFSPDGNTLYIGSIDGNSVHTWNRITHEFDTLVTEKNNAGLTQPSGIALNGYDRWLYIGSRGTRQILRFDLTDGTPDPDGPFIDNMPDEPEFLLFQ